MTTSPDRFVDNLIFETQRVVILNKNLDLIKDFIHDSIYRAFEYGRQKQLDEINAKNNKQSAINEYKSHRLSDFD